MGTCKIVIIFMDFTQVLYKRQHAMAGGGRRSGVGEHTGGNPPSFLNFDFILFSILFYIFYN